MCKHPHNDINPNTGKLYTRCVECREKHNKHMKQHYVKNRDKYLEYSKQYRIENRDKYLEYSKQYRIEKPFKGWVLDSKKSDIKYNRYDPDNFITEEYCEHIVEQSSNKCHYCICELSWEVDDMYNRSSNRATIERLNNNIGHIIGNCVVACHSCNSKKVSDKPFEERFKLRILNKTLIEVL